MTGARQLRARVSSLRLRARGSVVVSAAVLCASAGCVERRVWIESTPSGALVWLNDAQVGRTPVEVAFTHHGVYDVRLEKEGFEPLLTSADTDGPLWDTPPMDLAAELMPMKAKCDVRWSFTLLLRDDSESALCKRAAALRLRMAAVSQAMPATAAGDEPAVSPIVAPSAPTKND